jgi:hypothetical protein
MHKGIIILTKTKNKTHAINNARLFLEDTISERRDGIDYGSIGGRWNDIIRDGAQPYTAVKEIVKDWEEKQKAQHEEIRAYFLSECERAGITALKDLLAESTGFVLYLANRIRMINYKDFSTDMNVFDINEYDASTEYADKAERSYWAVMIDVHY